VDVNLNMNATLDVDIDEIRSSLGLPVVGHA